MTDTNSSNNPVGSVPPPPPPFSPPPFAYEASGELEANPDARLWGMFCHLFALAGFFIPFGNVIGPLIAWLIKKDQYAFVDDQGKESLNFQITVLIALICAGLTIFIFVGFILMPAVALFGLIFTIIGTIEANKGKRYRYPVALRLIK